MAVSKGMGGHRYKKTIPVSPWLAPQGTPPSVLLPLRIWISKVSRMVELGLNILLVGGIAAPLFLLERLKRQSAWVYKRHGQLSMLPWAICIVALYVFVLPKLHMGPNPRFFDRQPCSGKQERFTGHQWPLGSSPLSKGTMKTALWFEAIIGSLMELILPDPRASGTMTSSCCLS
jgi:hypothetical protein